MRTPSLLVQKTSDFSKFMVCPHRLEEGLNQCDPFLAKGEGVDFSQFCANVLYGWPLNFVTVSMFLVDTTLTLCAESLEFNST